MLPRETILALFPQGRTVGRRWPYRPAKLGVLTLAHAAALEALGCGMLDGFVTDAHALKVAWILTLPPKEAGNAVSGDSRRMIRFAKTFKGRMAELSVAVNSLVSEALLPFVPPKSDGAHNVLNDGLARGYGWPLEVAEALCERYGWPFEKAMETPVSRAFGLIAVGRANNGGEAGGPDYYDRIRLERWRALGIIGKGAKNG